MDTSEIILLASQLAVVVMAAVQIAVARKMWPFMSMQHRQGLDDEKVRQEQEAKKQAEDKLRHSATRLRNALVHDRLPEDVRRDLHDLLPVLLARPEDDHD